LPKKSDPPSDLVSRTCTGLANQISRLFSGDDDINNNEATTLLSRNAPYHPDSFQRTTSTFIGDTDFCSSVQALTNLLGLIEDIRVYSEASFATKTPPHPDKCFYKALLASKIPIPR
jgi:hypothetical protein